MANRRTFWAALTLVSATAASCGTSVEHTFDGGAHGGGGATSSAMSTGAGGGGGKVSGSSSSGSAGGGGAAGECGPGKPVCDDTNPCTLDACDPATLKCAFTPMMQGAPCNVNGGKLCDGNGACVACNVDGDCPGKTDDCQHPACINHTCGQAYTPANTPVSPALQIPSDCHVIVCDGAGNTKNNVDDTDIQSDGNVCTKDICTNGVSAHPALPAGTPCGGGHVCNGNGTCNICLSDAECTPPQTCGGCGMPGLCCCQPKTCAQLGASCGVYPSGCGGVAQCDNNIKDNGETDVDCGGPSCSVKCGIGSTCIVNTDCISNSCAFGICQ